MTNFVLVHGAFHGSWCWSRTINDLDEAGHTVVTPDLPGAGDDQTSLEKVTLESATERVVDALRGLDGPAVLVGHSMGGVVITQAAAQAPELVSRLVYVTAFRPMDGESLLDLTNLPEGAGDGVQTNITVEGEPAIASFDLTQASNVFYNDLPQDVAQTATARLDPQPLAVFATPVRLKDAALPPQEYIVCSQDRAIMPALQRLMAERQSAVVHELDSGHSPFFSRPVDLLQLLSAAGQRA